MIGETVYGDEVYEGPSLPPPRAKPMEQTRHKTNSETNAIVCSVIETKNGANELQESIGNRFRKTSEDETKKRKAVNAEACEQARWSHRESDKNGDRDFDEHYEYDCIDDRSLWWTLEAREFALSRNAKVQLNAEIDLPCEDARERQQKAATGEFNVWYGKSATTPGELSYHDRKLAPTRCVAAFDCGSTKADALDDTTENTSIYWCLHFARGRCTYGNCCEYVHRLPTGLDDAKRKDLMYDLFGRSKHALEKADNSGAGSYLRDVRTLFIYYAGSVPEHWGSDRMEREIRKDFGEWGPIEAVDVKHDRTFCFVRYKFRASAEFAKEAMEGQRIGNSKIHELPLSVRWANDDPNPVAIVRVKRERETLVADAIIRGIEKKKMALSAKDTLEQKMLEQLKDINNGDQAEYPETDHLYDDEQGHLALANAEKEKKEEEERYAKSFRTTNEEESDDDNVDFDPDAYESD